MNKLLTIFGSISLTTTTSFLVIACKESKQFDNKITKSNNNKIDENKTIKENKEKSNLKKEEDKREMNKDKLTEEANKDKKDQEEQIQNDQPRENDQYQPKRSNEDNFNLIKKYGKEIVDFLFPNSEKLTKLYSNVEKSYLSKLIGQVTSLYNEIAQYSDINEFQLKTTKYNLKNGDLYRQFDEIVTDYETQKDNIWSLLRSI
ncbi:lipoprotein [Mycoplasma capricolum subsp. capricolum]|uniref:lipoprotein n=1 Tax=Mycoplasma capricolum TaxID=2095 RepID=UPI003DA4E9B7